MMKIATLNINGLVIQKKRQQSFDYLKQSNNDVFCLQETHGSNDATTKRWTKEWNGQAFWSHGTHKSRGTAILIKPNLQLDVLDTKSDTAGRIMSILISKNNLLINIISIYAPTKPAERKLFFNSIQQYTIPSNETLILGDFNCIECLDKDKQGGNPTKGQEGITELRNITETLNITDIWRDEHLQAKEYTWAKSDYSIRSRLDRIYAKKELTKSTNIFHCLLTDHSMVTTELLLPNGRGPGVWKMNVDILQDTEFNHEMAAFLKYWKHEQATFNNNLDEWWEVAKVKIKYITIKHTVRKAKKTRDETRELQEELNRLQQVNRPNTIKIEEKKQELQRQLDEKYKGAQIRSRARWVEEGEKPTKYFLRLEKQKQQKNTIQKLRTDQGIKTTDLEIQEEIYNFYKHLYTKEETNKQDQDWLLNQIDKQLTEQEKQSCEGPVTADELTKALNEIQNNKAPGPDGLTAEFYKKYWHLLKDHLTILYNGNYEKRLMTLSQRQALLRLLFKKTDKEYLKYWRPISLLNTDYKLLSKTIACRLKKVLPSIIHTDQTCGIPGRTIFENLFKLRDVTYDAIRNNSNLILISLDQQKAFDRVNHGYLQRILKKFNFGPSFMQWVQTLYEGAFCNALNNGWLTDDIPLERGLRQGCPLSPLLFVITAEPLGQAIRNDKRIQGIYTPGGGGDIGKITQYADDSTLTLKDDESVQRSFDIIKRYEAGSGAKLNYEKTEGVYVGTQNGRQHGPVPITWKTGNLTILGAEIGPNLENQNWEKPVKKLKQRFQLWSSRKLTIAGRALIIRIFGLANIIFLTTVFNIPQPIIQRINSIVFAFLWGGKTELIKRSTLRLPVKLGGLGIPDIETMNKSMKTKWIQQITDQDNTRTWTQWSRFYIGLPLSSFKYEWLFLRNNTKPHADPNNLPPWYQTVHETAQEIKTELSKMDRKQIQNKILYDILLPKEQTRAERKWKDEHNIDNEKVKAHWPTIWRGLANNKEQETLWRLSHSIITSLAYLKTWKRMINDDKCPFCNNRETTEHLFRCNRTKDIWNLTNSIIRKLELEEITTMTETVFQQYSNRPNEKLKRYLTTITLDIIWNTRNKRIAGEMINDLQDQLKKKIRNRITCDISNNKLGNLELIWMHKKILADRINGKIVLII